VYCEIWKTKPSAAAINSILVPPKLKNGNVIPVNGISPIMSALHHADIRQTNCSDTKKPPEPIFHAA